jgi:hypothetical protein
VKVQVVTNVEVQLVSSVVACCLRSILAYVEPAQYRTAHQLLERHVQLQEAEKAAARRASKNRQQQQQQQLNLDQWAREEPRQLTNAEKKREAQQRAAASTAAGQREGGAAGVQGHQAVAEAFPGPEVDMQGEEEDEERQRFYSPASEFEEDMQEDIRKASNGPGPADSGQRTTKRILKHQTDVVVDKEPAEWRESNDTGGNNTSPGSAPVVGAAAAAAAADGDLWQLPEVAGSEEEEEDDLVVRSSARKAKAAAQRRQQQAHAKRRRTLEQQQQQSDVHPEQEEDAIDDDMPLTICRQQLQRKHCRRQQQQQQDAEGRQSRQVSCFGTAVLEGCSFDMTTVQQAMHDATQRC